MQKHMEEYAAELRYEQAQNLKIKINEVQKLLAPSYRWVRPLDEFYVLSFQTGPRVKIRGQRRLQPSVTPFLIGPGWISQIESFPLGHALEACQTLMDRIQLSYFKRSLPDQPNLDQEILAWIANFLYRNTLKKGLYLPLAGGQLDAENMTRRLGEYFARPEKKSAGLQLDTFSLLEKEESES